MPLGVVGIFPGVSWNAGLCYKLNSFRSTGSVSYKKVGFLGPLGLKGSVSLRGTLFLTDPPGPKVSLLFESVD